MLGIAVNKECRFVVKMASGRFECILDRLLGQPESVIKLKNLYQMEKKEEKMRSFHIPSCPPAGQWETCPDNQACRPIRELSFGIHVYGEILSTS
jgi:hypothetical protein